MLGVVQPNKSLKKLYNPKAKYNKELLKKVLSDKKKEIKMAKNSVIPRVMGNFIKPVKRVKIVYDRSGGFSKTVTTEQSATRLLRINNIFDPDYSNVTGNTEADGYTIAKNYYQRYRVESVDYDIQCFPYTSNTGPLKCVAFPCNEIDAAVISSTKYIGEYANRAGAKRAVMGVATGGKGYCRLKGKIKIKDVLGLTPEQFEADTETSAAFETATTTKVAYLALAIGDVNDSAVRAASIDFNSRITYHLALLDPYDYKTDQ